MLAQVAAGINFLDQTQSEGGGTSPHLWQWSPEIDKKWTQWDQRFWKNKGSIM